MTGRFDRPFRPHVWAELYSRKFHDTVQTSFIPHVRVTSLVGGNLKDFSGTNHALNGFTLGITDVDNISTLDDYFNTTGQGTVVGITYTESDGFPTPVRINTGSKKLPPPGITSVEISTVAKGGFTFHATVDFKFYGKEQYDFIYQTIMRPGNPIVIEFGQTRPAEVAGRPDSFQTDLGFFKRLDDRQIGIFKEQIKNNRQLSSNFNSGAVTGQVSNFNIKLNDQNEYEGQIEVINTQEFLYTMSVEETFISYAPTALAKAKARAVAEEAGRPAQQAVNYLSKSIKSNFGSENNEDYNPKHDLVFQQVIRDSVGLTSAYYDGQLNEYVDELQSGRLSGLETDDGDSFSLARQVIEGKVAAMDEMRSTEYSRQILLPYAIDQEYLDSRVADWAYAESEVAKPDRQFVSGSLPANSDDRRGLKSHTEKKSDYVYISLDYFFNRLLNKIIYQSYFDRQNCYDNNVAGAYGGGLISTWEMAKEPDVGIVMEDPVLSHLWGVFSTETTGAENLKKHKELMKIKEDHQRMAAADPEHFWNHPVHTDRISAAAVGSTVSRTIDMNSNSFVGYWPDLRSANTRDVIINNETIYRATKQGTPVTLHDENGAPINYIISNDKYSRLIYEGQGTIWGWTKSAGKLAVRGLIASADVIAAGLPSAAVSAAGFERKTNVEVLREAIANRYAIQWTRESDATHEQGEYYRIFEKSDYMGETTVGDQYLGIEVPHSSGYFWEKGYLQGNLMDKYNPRSIHELFKFSPEWREKDQYTEENNGRTSFKGIYVNYQKIRSAFLSSQSVGEALNRILNMVNRASLDTLQLKMKFESEAKPMPGDRSGRGFVYEHYKLKISDNSVLPQKKDIGRPLYQFFASDISEAISYDFDFNMPSSIAATVVANSFSPVEFWAAGGDPKNKALIHYGYQLDSSGMLAVESLVDDDDEAIPDPSQTITGEDIRCLGNPFEVEEDPNDPSAGTEAEPEDEIHREILGYRELDPPTMKQDIIAGGLYNQIPSTANLIIRLQGLEGFRFGDMFTVRNVLPKPYDENNIFMVTGWNHTIDSSGWYTNLEAQMWASKPQGLAEIAEKMTDVATVDHQEQSPEDGALRMDESGMATTRDRVERNVQQGHWPTGEPMMGTRVTYYKMEDGKLVSTGHKFTPNQQNPNWVPSNASGRDYVNLSRAEVNKNPFNLKDDGSKWQGAVIVNGVVQTETGAPGGFIRFTENKWGFRAGFKNFMIKNDRNISAMNAWSPPATRPKTNSINELLREATPYDDNKEFYDGNGHITIASKVGVGVDDPIDLNDEEIGTKFAFAVASMESAVPESEMQEYGTEALNMVYRGTYRTSQ